MHLGWKTSSLAILGQTCALNSSDADKFFSTLYVVGGAGTVRICFHVMLIFPFPTFSSAQTQFQKVELNLELDFLTHSVRDRFVAYKVKAHRKGYNQKKIVHWKKHWVWQHHRKWQPMLFLELQKKSVDSSMHKIEIMTLKDKSKSVTDVEKHLKMQMNAGLGTTTAGSVTDRGTWWECTDRNPATSKHKGKNHTRMNRRAQCDCMWRWIIIRILK